MDDLTGMQLGRYKLVELLGKSEVTQLYKAYDARLERHVALKLVTHSRDYSPDFVEYFLREARALARLSHAAIVKVLDFGQEEGYLFLVMEYVQGQSLQEFIGQPMAWREAANLLLPVAEGLEFAHQHNIVHRDLKPSNILLNAEGSPVISDFSVARMIEEEETREVMTGTNVGLGSPFYMSPEQGKGFATDYRADIYALGIIFFELLTGRRPFEAENGMEVVIKQVSEQAPSPKKFVKNLPEPVDAIIATMLRKDPDERFQSMQEFITALKEVLESGKYSGRRAAWSRTRWLVTAGVGLGLLLLVGGGLYFSGVFKPKPPVIRTQVAAVTEIRPTETAAGQKPAAPTATVEAAKPAAEKPTATQAPEPTAAATQPPAAAAAEAAVRDLPQYPLIEGQSLPEMAGAIGPENAGKLIEVARFGTPRLNALAWSQDSLSLVGATSAGVYFYNSSPLLSEGRLQPEGFFAARGWLTSLDVSKDGQWIATGDQAGMVRVWNARSGEERLALKGHTGKITRVKFSPDGKRLATASLDKTVRVWNAESGGDPTLTLTRHSLEVNVVIFSPDGKYVISGSNDLKAIVWDAASGEMVASFPNEAWVYDLAMSSDGHTLAAALGNAKVNVFDLQTKKQVRTIWDKAQVAPVTGVEYSTSGSLLATVSSDGLVRVWSSSGSLQWSKSAGKAGAVDKTQDQVIDLAFSNDARLATVTVGGTLTTWDLGAQKASVTASLGWTAVNRLGIAPDGKTLAVQVGSGQVQTWSLRTGSRILTYSGTIPRGTLFSQDSTRLVLQTNDKMDLYANESVEKKLKTLALPPANITAGYTLGDRIVGAASAQGLTLWATTSGYELSAKNQKSQASCKVAFSEEGEFLAAGSTVGMFTNPDAATFLCKIPRSSRARDEAFNQDGKYLAFGLDNGQVELWVNGPNASPETFTAAKGKVLGVALSPDNRLLATAGEDGLVKLWNPETKELLATLDHHTGPVYDVVFSADGTLLITSSEDGTFEVWGIPALKE